jgi:hypothetical protein
MQYPLCSSVNARTNFFLSSVSSSWCACRIFFLSGHFSAWRAQIFFWTLLLSPRAMLQIFLSSSLPCMRVTGANFFLSSRFQQLRAQFFFQPHTTAVCAAFCSCDQSLCHPRSKETIFLSLPCSSVRDTGRAELFFCAVLFSFAVRSHLRRHLVLIFFGAWNLYSPLFQNPASEI